MATATDKVTVDKSYLDALLRRADRHTAAQGLAQKGYVAISKFEYDSLLRSAREYEQLKTALFQGGLTADTLSLLVAGSGVSASQQDPLECWADDFSDQPPSYGQPLSYLNGRTTHDDSHWNSRAGQYYDINGHGNVMQHDAAQQSGTRISSSPSQVSYSRMPSATAEDVFDENGSFMDEDQTETAAQNGKKPLRTLYICNFPPQTTYRDLLSAMKGGKIVSANLRSERSATVTFLDAAADFLTWSKRNDVYINHKRVEVRWADRQFQLNSHINNKILNGATRNILIRSATAKGLTEPQIRDDMEHIHNLSIVDVTFRNGDAYVSTNSVHNALFARTCMLSRSTYKGCKIEFYADECDIPLPARSQAPRAISKVLAKKDVRLANRFNMLDVNDEDADSGAENREPIHENQVDDSDDDDSDTIDIKPRHGVRLDFPEMADVL